MPFPLCFMLEFIQKKKKVLTEGWHEAAAITDGVYSQTWRTISDTWWPQVINILFHCASSSSFQPPALQLTGKPPGVIEQPHRGNSIPKTFRWSLPLDSSAGSEWSITSRISLQQQLVYPFQSFTEIGCVSVSFESFWQTFTSLAPLTFVQLSSFSFP